MIDITSEHYDLDLDRQHQDRTLIVLGVVTEKDWTRLPKFCYDFYTHFEETISLHPIYSPEHNRIEEVFIHTTYPNVGGEKTFDRMVAFTQQYFKTLAE